jgi:hypothetical protein
MVATTGPISGEPGDNCTCLPSMSSKASITQPAMSATQRNRGAGVVSGSWRAVVASARYLLARA